MLPARRSWGEGSFLRRGPSPSGARESWDCTATRTPPGASRPARRGLSSNPWRSPTRGPERRLAAALVAAHPSLGVAPACRLVTEARGRPVRVASEPYGPSEPLLRVLVDADGSRLFVGAHHGAVDGLGLVAVAGAAAGLPVRARARGIGVRGRPARLPRVQRAPAGRGPGPPPAAVPPPRRARCRRWSRTSGSTRPHAPGGTAHLAHAVVAAYAPPEARAAAAAADGGVPAHEGELTPDRQTAYLRVRAARSATVPDLRARIAAAEPEPDFPETSARGIGPWVTHLLRGRLGATALLSNLGSSSEGLRLGGDVPGDQRSPGRRRRARDGGRHDHAEPAHEARRLRPGRHARLLADIGGRVFALSPAGRPASVRVVAASRGRAAGRPAAAAAAAAP